MLSPRNVSQDSAGIHHTRGCTLAFFCISTSQESGGRSESTLGGRFWIRLTRTKTNVTAGVSLTRVPGRWPCRVQPCNPPFLLKLDALLVPCTPSESSRSSPLLSQSDNTVDICAQHALALALSPRSLGLGYVLRYRPSWCQRPCPLHR